MLDLFDGFLAMELMARWLPLSLRVFQIEKDKTKNTTTASWIMFE